MKQSNTLFDGFCVSLLDTSFSPQFYYHYPHDDITHPGAHTEWIPADGNHNPFSILNEASAETTAAEDDSFVADEKRTLTWNEHVEDSTSDHRPAVVASSFTNSNGGKRKAKPTNAATKNSNARKKPRILSSPISNNNNNNSSSPECGEATGSNHKYSHIGPDPEEIAEVATERARIALESWYQRLRELMAFKDEHNHARVPQKYPKNIKLGVWVNKQRMEKRLFDQGNNHIQSRLNALKISKLEAAGFVWAKPKGADIWNSRFHELEQYKKEKGDVNVPTKYADNPALGRWVSSQRKMYKDHHNNNNSQEEISRGFSPEIERRIALLQSLGFNWNRGPSSIEFQ